MGRLIIRAVFALIALAVFAVVIVPVLAISILLIKLAIVGLLAAWLFRKIFGRSRKHEPMLVGPPIMDVSARPRDKYEIAAQKELDELGL
jgi:hypothetical protein